MRTFTYLVELLTAPLWLPLLALLAVLVFCVEWVVWQWHWIRAEIDEWGPR